MTIDIEDFEFAVADRFAEAFVRGPIHWVRTPRELATALAPDDAADRDSSVSVTVRAFFLIRRCLADILDIDVRSIRPTTRCADLLEDHTTRRIVWTHFTEILGVREAPRLHRPDFVAWPIAILTCVAGLSVMGAAATRSDGALPVLAGALATGVAGSILFRLTRAWAYDFSPHELTVGALAHFAVAYGSPILGDLAQPRNYGQTFEVIQSLARLEIGAPRVRPDDTWEQLVDLARAS